MKIAFLGHGNVGGALAAGLATAGHEVVVAARDLESPSVQRALARHDGLSAKLLSEAVDWAETVFLATPYSANGAVLDAAGDLEGKVLVDCTNPIGPGLELAVGGSNSGGEMVQRMRRLARVVKAFTVYGFENFEDSSYPGYGELRPAMPICGDDPTANEAVGALAADLGWEPIMTGMMKMARYLEPMTMLWIEMARVQGRGSGFTWAMLRR